MTRDEALSFLESISHHWQMYQQSGSMKDASVIHPERLQEAMRTLFEPRYVACLTCPESLRELFTKTFQLYDSLKRQIEQEKQLRPSNGGDIRKRNPRK